MEPRPASEPLTGAVLAGDALAKSFGPTPALQGATLAIQAGEVVALMGPSGSGKSTMLHCLAGITVPDSGAVRFEGEALYELSPSQRAVIRRRKFGFVFQFGLLVSELTMVDNVALPLMLDGMRTSRARARATALLESFGVAPLAKRLPGEVSGGEGQRVALARALVMQPAVVFADEPTGALDSTTGALVMQRLVDAAHELGSAVLLVTHDPAVAGYADRRVEIRDGRTVE